MSLECRREEDVGVEVSQAPGRIIFLNGVSGSGKSSIAGELLPMLEDTYFLMSVDVFNAMRVRGDYRPEELSDVLRRTRAGFHRAVAGMAAAGNNIVVDHVLSEQWRLEDCLALFAGFDVVFVGVHCDLDELERRERDREDRPVGLAAQQVEQVHAHGVYDVECDTTASRPRDCALQVTEFLSKPRGQRAFERLRQALLT